MIIGVVLRNFKVYKNINYIPLSNGTNFTCAIGQNGVGKSSILEALDCFFNGKEWIINVDSNGKETWIMPIIALKKEQFRFEGLEEKLEKITQSVLSDEVRPNPNYTTHVDELRKSIPSHVKEGYYIIPICKDEKGKLSFGIFNGETFKRIFSEDNDKIEEFLKDLHSKLIAQITYVYVPTDIPPEEFVTFENDELQRLIGQKLPEIVSQILSNESIKKISKGLKDYIDSLSESFGNYRFRTPNNNQPNLKPGNIYSLIVKEFFSVRQLYKKVGDSELPLRELSSGEKQQAIIKVITDLITNYRGETENKGLIIAVDEPESSLHISHCYDQFEKLLKVSESCAQVLATSHWYGFIPVLVKGGILYIDHKQNEKFAFNVFNAEKFREEVVQEARRENGIPIDVMIKSINDLVQSILSSIVRDDSYNWLICEGSSDKIYLNKYLSQEINEEKLRIIPVCTAGEVKRLYEHLQIPVTELKRSIKGKIFLLTDTDSQMLQFDTAEGVDGVLRCRRMVNVGNKTELVRIKSNPVSPKTDIEDALNGRAFYEALMSFKNQHDELAFLSEHENISETSSYAALNLRPSDYAKMDEFFSKEKSRYKVEFANKYVEIISQNDYVVPSWLEEIKAFFAHS